MSQPRVLPARVLQQLALAVPPLDLAVSIDDLPAAHSQGGQHGEGDLMTEALVGWILGTDGGPGRGAGDRESTRATSSQRVLPNVSDRVGVHRAWRPRSGLRVVDPRA